MHHLSETKEHDMPDITREQFFGFIKTENDKDGVVSKNTEHYLDYFDKYQRTGKKASWNWSALWGAFWFLHRQIDWFWFPLFLVDCILCTQLNSIGGLVAFITSRLLMSYYADYIYLKNVSRKIAKGQMVENPQSSEIMWGDPFFLPELLPIDLLIYLYKAIRDRNKKDILIVCGIILFLVVILVFKFYSQHH